MGQLALVGLQVQIRVYAYYTGKQRTLVTVHVPIVKGLVKNTEEGRHSTRCVENLACTRQRGLFQEFRRSC